jgi:hypothetical protein
MRLLATLLVLSLSVTFSLLRADEASRQKLIGEWTGGRYSHKLGADGVLYENDKPSCKWDVKDGLYYEVFNSPSQPDNPYDIITLTPTKFVYRYHPNGPETTTWTRVGGSK